MLDVGRQGLADSIAGQQHQPAQERSHGAARQNGDGEDDGGDEERVRNREDQNAVEMRRPVHGPPTLRIHPRHPLADKNPKRDTQHRYDGDQGGAEVAPGEIIEFLQRSREQHLMRVGGEIARCRRVHEGHNHQQIQQEGEGIVVLDDEGCVAVSIFKRPAHLDLVGCGRSKDQERDDQAKDPKHPRTQPIADFEANEMGQHAASLVSNYCNPAMRVKNTSSRSAGTGWNPSPGGSAL